MWDKGEEESDKTMFNEIEIQNKHDVTNYLIQNSPNLI